MKSPVSRPLFEECTKCTICTEYCPVSEAISAFPGPKQAGPDGERLRLKDPAFFDEALKLCTNCKRCEVACPSGVAIGDIIQLAKKRYAGKNSSLRDALLSHTDLVGSLAATPLAGLVNAAPRLGVVKKALEKVLGIPSQRQFPQYASRTFRRWFAAEAAAAQAAFPEQVAFFHGCYANYNNPALGRDVVAVLNALGVGVTLLSGEKCCGIPLIANGFFDDARKNALANSASIGRAAASGLQVLIASSTCAMTLRDEYPHVLDVDNASWRDKAVFLTRFVHARLEGKSDSPFKPLKMKVAYHTACHMERLGWAAYAVDLLRKVPGLAVQVLPSRCCGIAGTYGFKTENYETARKIGAGLFEDIEQSDADLILTECETCKMQIEMSTSKRCEHPVSLLAKAL